MGNENYQNIPDKTSLVNESSESRQQSQSRTSRILSSIGNPFPKSLNKSCLEAAKYVDSFLEHSQEQVIIPDRVLQECKGLLIATVIKGAYIWSGRLGSGLVVAKTEDGSWSPPVAINFLGVGYGFQVGLEITHLVIVLRDQNALNSMMQKGNLSIGANASVSLGPYGRTAEVDLPVTCSLMYTLSKSKGLFAGVSFELTLWLQHEKANQKFYGRKVSIQQILEGKVEYPKEAVILREALEKRFSFVSSIATPIAAPVSEKQPYRPSDYSSAASFSTSSSPQAPPYSNDVSEQKLYPPSYQNNTPTDDVNKN